MNALGCLDYLLILVLLAWGGLAVLARFIMKRNGQVVFQDPHDFYWTGPYWLVVAAKAFVVGYLQRFR